jgi:hypothetical protein
MFALIKLLIAFFVLNIISIMFDNFHPNLMFVGKIRTCVYKIGQFKNFTITIWHLQLVLQTLLFNKLSVVVRAALFWHNHRTLDEKGLLRTADLLINVACFVKK